MASFASLGDVSRTGGELVLDSLKAAGVDTVFGIISVHNMPIFDAIAREGGVRVVPARTEHGAAAMADGFARASGRLAALITSTGVGAANAAGPLLEAFAASSPVIHITGQVDAAYLDQDRGFLHGAKDQLGMLDRIGKAAFRATSTDEIPDVLRMAIELARAGRPGPVSVEIPIDQQYRSVNARVDPIPLPSPVVPDAEAIDKAARLIQQSRRPLIWAGGGTIAAGAAEALRRLAERIGAAVLTSASGRGALPEDHPQCVGFFGIDATVGPLIEQSDLLLAVGTRLRGNETRTWQLGLPSPRIQIDVEPSLLGRNYPIDVPIVGDARLALEALLRTTSDPADRSAWLATVAETRRAARARMRTTLGPYERVLDDLRHTLPRDAIVVRDVTIPATTWGGRLLETYLPRTALYSATYAIGMGFGLAIGAAIGRPDREVVLLAGDGGFVTAVGELATAAQERVRLRIVVFNDAGYGILRNLQDTHFDGRRFAVDLATPDFLKLAESFGVWSGQVRAAVEMAPVLNEALQQDGPALIEVDMAAVGPMVVPFTGGARLVPGR
jgi:acetolactate synthase-1/2/3 large subunit